MAGTNLEMYRTTRIATRIPVLCECYKREYEDDKRIPTFKKDCNRCDGKGWHYKSFTKINVAQRPIDIQTIDLDKKTKTLRFWESSCEYYDDKAFNSRIFFSRKDAQKECDRLNAPLYRKIHDAQMSYDLQMLGVQIVFTPKAKHACYVVTNKTGDTK